MIFESLNEQDTLELGRKLALSAGPGDVYALDGDLGTGKTVFTKGFAQGIGIVRPVSSPTFTILQVYEEGRLPLYHFDVYRIGDPEEMEEIGFDEYLFGQGVCLIEWAEIVRELLPENTVKIVIEKDPEKGNDYRRIRIADPRVKNEDV